MSQQTSTDIANMALAYVGERLITNLQDSRTPEAQLVRTFFDISRRAELEVFDWSFARRFRTLAVASGDTPPDVRFDLAYILPADCLTPRNIEPFDVKAPIPYQVVQNESGQRLVLTSTPSAILRYTFDQTDAGVFTTNFTLALSHRLASSIAYARTKKQSVREAELILAKEARLLAQAADGNTAQESFPEPVAEWHAARGYITPFGLSSSPVTGRGGRGIL